MKLPSLFQPVGALLALTSLLSCSQQQVVASLRSLSGSEDAVFLCRDDTGAGHPFTDCPDRNSTDDAKANKHLSVIALVSQTVTDEVAVVDVSAGHVVDVDPSTPGYGFLRVGGRPVSMAATPGGAATFVATADVGRNGIFTLPTQCLEAPKSDDPPRDLTTWAACRLDETPGEMAVLVESAATESSCTVNDTPDESKRSDCQADVEHEKGAVGRRKLVVSLPDSGRLVVFDAQRLANIGVGTFPSCEPYIEKTLVLQADVPAGVAQRLPADLSADNCTDAAPPMAPPPSRQSPRPAGFAVADNRLYIADQAAPVIHVLDTTSVCGMTELPSLLPMSLREPERVVTTSRVAVSPLTPAGQRFVYAIDREDQPGASVMMFDVSPDATDRTPIVRSGSPELPGEKPDRLALTASARDVTFAYRDIPYVDPLTGAAQFGTRCDPDPFLDPTLPAALARPSSDFVNGARPGLLRGLFGFILLTNGSIAVVDVDDFDQDCRRPIQANHSETPDFRGCVASQDPRLAKVDFFAQDNKDNGTPFVTNEASCRIVEPHRFRSARLDINNATVGVRAPSLRGFPQLTMPASAQSAPSEDRPRLLAAPFPTSAGPFAEVFVGSTRYSTDADSGGALPVAPNAHDSQVLQSLNAVVLPPLEPRSYAADDTVTLTFEGSYAGDRTSGFLSGEDGKTVGVLRDASLSFCAAGVYDIPTMTGYATDVLGLRGADATQFGQTHADYVQLTTALPAADDTYWKKAGVSRVDCLLKFGAEDADPLLSHRDFAIQQAFADRLVLAPRVAEVTLADALACFPTAQTYRLRSGQHWVLLHGSGFRHDVVASGADNACVRSCDPLKKWAKGRAFEISSADDDCRTLKAPGDPLELRVGCAAGEVACVYRQSESASALSDPAASRCIFDGLNERFALYRGRQPSVRDAAFSWQTTGGFTPLVMSLTTLSSVVAPQSIQYLRQGEQMAIVDGASLGLSLFSLDTFGVVSPSPFY